MLRGKGSLRLSSYGQVGSSYLSILGCQSALYPNVTSSRYYSTKHDMFDKILIANRGEIACRVMRTCKKMGVKTVAVFSAADANSMHVDLADEAHYIGPPPAKESYLKGGEILDIAKKTGAKAIHPGYGFLSENAAFSQLCEERGLVFIGPPASAIRSMGSKSASKEIMSGANVPVIPGYHGANQDVDFLLKEADKIGYPILIKAVSGGGGKGMRIVNNAKEFEEALNSAKREATSSFGDDRVLIEKYLKRPRHVEFQIFADKYGNAVHLFERDCSVQRRHQKIIEEAPAPHMPEELRNRMGVAAVNAAKAVGYVGAGTVEFILNCDDNSFYFMEMNTRLQVEHPITEMITGQDLVEWQLRVAAGETLPLRQEDLKINGHAFEARVYAENPRRGFLPGTGKLFHLSPPTSSPTVRVETGVRQGDEVSVFYDPMIAKLVVWDKDRKSALRKLGLSLAEYRIVGLTTNIDFLNRLSTHPAFIAGEVETGFIPRYHHDLFKPAEPPSPKALAMAVLAAIAEEKQEIKHVAEKRGTVNDPWTTLSGYRAGYGEARTFKFVNAIKEDNEEKGQEYTVHVTYLSEDNYTMKIRHTTKGEHDVTLNVSGKVGPNGDVQARIGEEMVTSAAHVLRNGDTIHIFEAEGCKHSQLDIPVVKYDSSASSKGALTAPMPGKIIQLLVNPKQFVKKGEPIVVMEAMKMEHTIRAPADGVVKSVHCDLDQFVEQSRVLVRMEDAAH